VRGFADAVGLPCVSLLGSQLAPEDIIGVPQIVAGKSRFCPPTLIARDEPYYLFLDELNACSHEVQKAFTSLALAVHGGGVGLDDKRKAGSEARQVFINPHHPSTWDTMQFVIAHELLHVARRLAKARTFRGVKLGDILAERPPDRWRGAGIDLDEFYRPALAEGLGLHAASQGRGLLPGSLLEEIRVLRQSPIPGTWRSGTGWTSFSSRSSGRRIFQRTHRFS
jgi:hypothetical protein